VSDPRVEQVISAGRRVEVVVAGPDGGLVCVVHRGTPSAALTFGPTQAAVVGDAAGDVSAG